MVLLLTGTWWLAGVNSVLQGPGPVEQCELQLLLCGVEGTATAVAVVWFEDDMFREGSGGGDIEGYV